MNFPTTPDAFQLTAGNAGNSGGTHAFVAKVNPIGSALVYSTYLSGSEGSHGLGIAVDAAGNAYVTGSASEDFPTMGSIQAVCTGAFVTKLNPTGSALVYSTCLGGSKTVGGVAFTIGHAIAVDAAGNAYVTGETDTLDFPIVNALQPVFGGSSSDAFVAKVVDTHQATIVAMFENPETFVQIPVSGIAVIRGWAFAPQPSVQIGSVDLFIDGISSGTIPCCSERADVQAAFPQFPAANTLNSGWGTTFNWEVLPPGVHSVRVGIRDTAGDLLWTDTRIVTVIKPGNAEFLDQFDLSGATASLVGGAELDVDGVVVRDKATQLKKKLNTRFLWSTSSQSFRMIEATTVGQVTSVPSLISSLVAALSVGFRGVTAPAKAQTNPGIMAVFESPEQSQVNAGIGIIRGWAVASQAGAQISRVDLFIDGVPSGTIPCCSERGDVAAAFSGNPNALNSEWGATFNYGVLSSGFHTIGVQIKDSTGAFFSESHGVTTVRIGGFEFVEVSGTSGTQAAQIEGEDIIVPGVSVYDKATKQNKTVTLRLRWLQDAQALGIVASSS